MGRPDLTEQRTGEILDAFERCVVRHGLEGSTLDRVAEEAGVKRPLIRHYLGNREDVVIAFAQRLIDRYETELQGMLDRLPETDRVNALFRALFPSAAAYSVESTLVLESMIACADRIPGFKELLGSYIDSLTTSVAREIRREVPAATRSACWSVACGVVGLCFNQESLTPLSLPPRYRRAHQACARRLVDSLHSSTAK